MVGQRMCILVATDRASVEGFIEGVGQRAGHAVWRVPISASELAGSAEHAREATVALIDVAPSPLAAIELGRELRRTRPELPIVAYLCCPHAMTDWHLKELASCVDSAIDMLADENELLEALHRVVEGGLVLHVAFGLDGRILLDGLSTSGRAAAAGDASAADLGRRMIELVAQGASDRDISRLLHLSRHTVSHRIGRLCAELGLRNRTALAAWAGRHGFYPNPATA